MAKRAVLKQARDRLKPLKHGDAITVISDGKRAYGVFVHMVQWGRCVLCTDGGENQYTVPVEFVFPGRLTAQGQEEQSNDRPD